MKEQELIRTYKGELRIGTHVVPCYVTPDERRILSGRAVASLLGLTDEPKGATQTPGSRIRRLFGYSAFKPILEAKLGLDHLDSLKWKDEGMTLIAFEASRVVDLCDAILEVRKRVKPSALTDRQLHIIDSAELLIRSVAKVGIIALVDEATGFQYTRDRRALETILNRIIAEELRPWVKLFPDEFYDGLFKLYGMKAPRDSSKRPLFFAKLTIDLIYDRIPIPGGVYSVLRDKSTDQMTGKRGKERLHQWLKDEGRDITLRQIWRVTGAMDYTPNLTAFKRAVDRMGVKIGKTMNLLVNVESINED